MTTRATYRVGIAAAVLSLVATVAPFAASAQKYPERRATRFGTKSYLRGDYADAEQRYRRALELDPELREATFNLGGALWRQAQGAVHEGLTEEEQQAIGAQAQEAAKLYQSLAADSLAPAPLVSAASYNLGNTALAGRQIDAAIEAYKSALRLTPNDMEAKFNLAYAQKLKQQQQQNDDQNKDRNKDDQGGGGGGGDDQNDRQNDPNKDDQNGDGKDDPKDGDGDKDDKNGNGDQNGDGRNDPKDGDGQGGGRPKIDPRTAEQMLDAMQAAEDGTREKVDAKKVQAGSHSGKNW